MAGTAGATFELRVWLCWSWEEPQLLGVSCCTTVIFKAPNTSSEMPWNTDPVWTHSSSYLLTTSAGFLLVLGSSSPPQLAARWQPDRKAHWEHAWFTWNWCECLVRAQHPATAILGHTVWAQGKLPLLNVSGASYSPSALCHLITSQQPLCAEGWRSVFDTPVTASIWELFAWQGRPACLYPGTEEKQLL